MVTSPQVIEMLNELRDDELSRVSRHRIDALTYARQHQGVRKTVASALVRLGTALDHEAGARTQSSRVAASSFGRAVDRRERRLDDGALHW